MNLKDFIIYLGPNPYKLSAAKKILRRYGRSWSFETRQEILTAENQRIAQAMKRHPDRCTILAKSVKRTWGR
jgi:hypothetical protein